MLWLHLVSLAFSALRVTSSITAPQTLPQDSLADTSTTAVAARFDQLAARVSTLDTLLAQCRTRGIPTAYERVDYTTITQFLPWGRADLRDHRDDAVQIVTQLEQLYDTAATHLRGYLAGTRHAVAAPQYVTQRSQIAGYSFLGDMRWPDGHIEHHRPIFFTGYGFFGQVLKDLPALPGYGANIIQNAIGGISNVVFPRGAIDWPVITTGPVDAHFLVDTTVAHTGRRSMVVTNTTPYQDSASAAATLTYYVVPHTTYRVSVWVKGDHVSHAHLVLGADAADVHPLPDESYAWRHLTFSFTTSEDAFQRSITVRSAGPTGHLWLDDIRVSAAGQGENLIPDPGFEAIPSVPPGQVWYTSATQTQAGLVQELRRAAQSNVAVNVQLQPGDMPAFAFARWPELAQGDQQFIPYNVLDPHAKAIVAAYLRTVIPLIKGSPALHSVTLTNEPTYQPKGDAADQAAWHVYLQHTYGTVARLNAAYGATYQRFVEVPVLPNVSSRGRAPDTDTLPPMLLDWITFNSARFARWHRWMADLIHQLAPTLPVTVKLQTWPTHCETMINGADFAAVTQISGYDSWDPEHLRALAVAPLFNTEEHLVQFDPSAAHARTALWQDAIHGQTASTIWVWERHAEDNLLQMPAVVAAVGTANLDLNRLAREVTAFQTARAPVAILHAPLANWNIAEDYAATALVQSGQHYDYVWDRPAGAAQLKRYRLVIVPAHAPFSVATLTGVAQFAEAGGTVVTLGNPVMRVDDHGQPVSATLRNRILAHALVINTTTVQVGVRAALQPILARAGLLRMQVLDSVTQQPVDSMEWEAVRSRGRWLINLVSSAGTPRAVILTIDGRRIAQATDLISGVTQPGTVLHVRGITPYLFAVP